MKPFDTEKMYDSIIIGGGPAGLSAAIYLARARYRVLILEKEKIGGQITITSEVVNYPGVLSSSGAELTENMRKQAEHFGAEFLRATATELKLEGDIKEVLTDRGTYQALGIILATGARPRKVGFQGEEKFRGRGVAYCATCDGEFFSGMDVFVLGGGYAAAEEAIFLTKYAKKVKIMVRKPQFSCAGSIVEEVMAHPDIEVYFNTEIIEVGGDPKMEYAIFRDTKNQKTEEYKPDEGEGFGIFVFAGYEPATFLFKNKVALNEAGYLQTDRNQKTSVNGVYGAGDVCVKSLRQVVTSVSDGAVAATSLERYISNQYETLHLKKRSAGKADSKVKSKIKESPVEEDDSGFITAQMREQLEPVFARFENNLILEVYPGKQKISAEVQAFAAEIEGLTKRIRCKVKTDAPADILTPSIRICKSDGTYLGTSFHGVPGGHEFNSFIIALYNAAGPGQAIDETILERVHSLKKNEKIQVMVSLSCTMCPELVMAVQRIALESENVECDIYDLAHFPDLKQKYQVMSVPCMVINEKDIYFGKKGMEEILNLLEGTNHS